MHDNFKKVEMSEILNQETVFLRDIETRVFQAITLKCLSQIDGIALIEGSFIDHLLGREGIERNKGIYIEQDNKNSMVSVKLELNVGYGISIPEKAQEIQSKVLLDIQKYTGLGVSCVHLIFKSLLPDEDLEKILSKQMDQASDASNEFFNEFSEEF